MLQHVETMYTDMKKMLKHMKRPIYEKHMKIFREENHCFFIEMLDYLNKADDKKQAAEEIAEVFVDTVAAAHTKKGKILGKVNVDLNFFTVYYVFPALLLAGDEEAEIIADAICEKWALTFQEGNISYASYEVLCNSFQTKIFGIF